MFLDLLSTPCYARYSASSLKQGPWPSSVLWREVRWCRRSVMRAGLEGRGRHAQANYTFPSSEHLAQFVIIYCWLLMCLCLGKACEHRDRVGVLFPG
jgi:hypothetical protein